MRFQSCFFSQRINEFVRSVQFLSKQHDSCSPGEESVRCTPSLPGHCYLCDHVGGRPAYLLHIFQSQTSESLGENFFALTHPYRYSSPSDFYHHDFPRCHSCSSHLHSVFLLHCLTLQCTSISFYIITQWKNSIFTSVWQILTDTFLSPCQYYREFHACKTEQCRMKTKC